MQKVIMMMVNENKSHIVISGSIYLQLFIQKNDFAK